MAKLDYDKKKIKKLEDQVTELIKMEIRRKKLVDTGSLLKSISTKVTFNGSNISIEVSGNDYYKYHLDDEYSISKDALSGSAYNEIVEDIQDIYVTALEKNIG